MELFPAAGEPVPRIDSTKAHPARVYDYRLGGKNHFAADRRLATQVLASMPAAATVARESRRFLGRVIRFLAAEAGVRQFLDIGAGLPATENVHEIAQGIDPTARVAYVDTDPLVLAHARVLLRSTPEGRAGCLLADLRDPGAILDSPVTRKVLDFGEPVGLLLVSVLPFLTDEDDPAKVVATLVDALPPGSYLAATHAVAQHDPAAWVATVRAYRAAGIQCQLRDPGQLAKVAFAGLEMVPPGLVLVSRWRPDGDSPQPSPAEVSCYGAVARKR